MDIAPVRTTTVVSDLEMAKSHFKIGVSYYTNGEYEKALAEFRAAYKLSRNPEFNFNIGQCLRMLEKNEEAVSYFQRYLDEVPNAQNRADVLATIEGLRKEIAAKVQKDRYVPPPAVKAPAPAPRPVVETSATVPPARPFKIAKWATLGLGLGVAVAGGLVYQDARKTNKNYRNRIDELIAEGSIVGDRFANEESKRLYGDEMEEYRDKIISENRIGLGLLAGGAALLGLGTAFFIIDSKQAIISVEADGTQAGLNAAIEF